LISRLLKFKIDLKKREKDFNLDDAVSFSLTSGCPCRAAERGGNLAIASDEIIDASSEIQSKKLIRTYDEIAAISIDNPYTSVGKRS